MRGGDYPTSNPISYPLRTIQCKFFKTILNSLWVKGELITIDSKILYEIKKEKEKDHGKSSN